ncbi:acyl-CoA dehydrogenase family protein [Trebonia sp.]|uniref:acyl-CoA dehydrogenase family protein n=1 Tax=Trebonia sp. TaxID=2767075 RepID=UPI00262703A1|nr:acyl-CoA dehydrogenase family protein [Trebonia sp.]
MPFDFSLPVRVTDWRDRIARFVDDVVIPREQDAFAAGVDDALRKELQQEAKAAGLWAPQLPADLGGGGFAFDEAAVLLEEAGRSLLGPLALNCSAPDEGNMHMLHMLATPAQRERYLLPLAAGDIRSCFAMTEPPPGAGSDPAALRTTATRTSGGWVIAGDKHLISGAQGAAFAIVMAASPQAGGATMLLVDAGNPGFVITGHARTIDAVSLGGHCRVRFDSAFVPDDAVLGAPGEGLRYAQVRLAPARLTHCMRWLGAARRAHEIALARSVSRSVFGAPLAEHGMAQQMIADNEIELAAARALLWQVAWQVAQGDKSTEASSRAKVFISEAVSRVVDRSVQLCGGLGTSEELVVGRIYADVRAFRIYDGASEVHRMSIARRAARRARADG